ncbi:hypothetical protein, conserved [Trypanosoma brucei gambiense DAL972]|uniref:Uncharacterized protein n=1 Tax=Trypanosoma brucei gambiense (strain MHOM/CI/86/DAL972) TaxID=679716 RepID=C9ZWV9_TRYB9|nr:hypothetical protein, conserved [Trypanosoma brucei gambiense DAL972]CBH13898.1 hypothetical protein, conserved [Trypanosoma brucei gambiense DAL972]|eukprot:XP_011776174.1 hypothetical protein, conserved [Trypanosoma brucei gambiense DAL972]
MCVYCAFDNEWLLLFHFYSSFTKEMRTRTTMTSGAPRVYCGAFVRNRKQRKILCSLNRKLKLCPYCGRLGCSRHVRRCGGQLVNCSVCGSNVVIRDLDDHFFRCGEQCSPRVTVGGEEGCCEERKVCETYDAYYSECSNGGCSGDCAHPAWNEVPQGRQDKGDVCVVCDLLLVHPGGEEGHVHCKGHVFECTTCGQVFMTAVEYAMHFCCGRTDPEPKSSTCGLSEDTVKDRGGCSYPTWETSCLSVSPLKGPAPHTPVATRSQSPSSMLLSPEISFSCPSLLRAAAVKPPSRSFEKSSGASSGVLGGNQAKKSKSRPRGDPSTEARDDLGRRQPNKGIHAAEGTASSNFRVSGRAESVPRNRVSEEGGCSTGLVGRNNVWRPLPLFAGDGGRRMGPSRMSSAAGSLRSSVMDSRERDGEHGTTIWRIREAQPDSFIPIVEKTSPSHHQSHSATVIDCMGSSVSVTTINNREAAPLSTVNPQCRKNASRCQPRDVASMLSGTRCTVCNVASRFGDGSGAGSRRAASFSGCGRPPMRSARRCGSPSGDVGCCVPMSDDTYRQKSLEMVLGQRAREVLSQHSQTNGGPRGDATVLSFYLRE